MIGGVYEPGDGLGLVPRNRHRGAMRVYGILDAVNAGEDKLNEQEMNEAGGE